MRRRVVIVGGGFAGLWAVRALAREPVDVTLLDRTNHHLFQPLLYEVATAGLSAPDIAAPLRHILRDQRNVTVIRAEVSDIDLAQRTVIAGGQRFAYDYLLVASGCSHSYFAHPEWEPDAPGLKTLDDALAMRWRILRAFEEAERESDAARRAAWLRFAVIGGGPTGVELAGTLAEIARHTLPGEFRRSDPGGAEIHLIEAGPRVLAAMRPELSRKAQEQLQRLGVTVHVGSPVTHIDAAGLSIGAQRLECRTVLWAAGVAASPLGRLLAAQLSPPGTATPATPESLVDAQGRVRVLPDLSVPDHPEVFVAGDLARIQVNGQWVPGVAPAAKQMGAHVAKMIAARVAGRATAPFVYRDFGALATIGRSAAVVDFGRLRLSGYLAWVFWLGAHVFFLIGFRNRIVVMLNWAWAYVTHQRHARVMLTADERRSRSTR